MDTITVRYVGPAYAVLGGKAIRTGEVRTVSRQQLDEARRYHPEGFQVLGGEVKPESLPETEWHGVEVPVNVLPPPESISGKAMDWQGPPPELTIDPEPVKAVVKRGSVKKKKS